MSTATRTLGRTRTRTRASTARVEVVRAGPTAETMLVGSVTVLCLLGLVMVYSASSVASVQRGDPSWVVVARQAFFMIVGLGAGLAAAQAAIIHAHDRSWADT